MNLLVARSFYGGELVGGETPWWRGDHNNLFILLHVASIRVLKFGITNICIFEIMRFG